MRRLFAFIASLVQAEAYCTVRFRLWKGRLKGPIEVETQYLEDTLPEPQDAAQVIAAALQDQHGG